jgi:hypothetical protein
MRVEYKIAMTALWVFAGLPILIALGIAAPFAVLWAIGVLADAEPRYTPIRWAAALVVCLMFGRSAARRA